MRKLVLGIVGLAMVAGLGPAGANHPLGQWHEFTLGPAPVPCMVYCAYWLDSANTDVDGDGTEDIYFAACGAPFPEGSYADLVVTAPANARLLEFQISPPLDWDSFICSKPTQGNNGALLGSGAHAVGDTCDGIIGPDDPTGTGCSETVVISAVPGQRYVLRGYNWQDVPEIPARYRFRAG